MNAKRGDRVAPPPGEGHWDVRYGNTDAVAGWEELCRQVPGNTRRAWETLCTDPRRRNDRQHPLKGKDLASGTFKGKVLPRWQLEATGGGRIWYLIDDEERRVILVYAGTGHPKATD
jgi:hypothetical protein